MMAWSFFDFSVIPQSTRNRLWYNRIAEDIHNFSFVALERYIYLFHYA